MAGRSASEKGGQPGPGGWLLRGAMLMVLLWAGGLFFFVWFQTRPAMPDMTTDGVAVLTGGPKRLARGGEVLRQGLAERLLVSGVNPKATPEDIRRELRLQPDLFRCCVDLGFMAATTHDNAAEVAEWVARHHLRSVRIVTAGYHMLRARREIIARLPSDVVIVTDGVPAYLPTRAMVREYHKFVASHLLLLVQVRS